MLFQTIDPFLTLPKQGWTFTFFNGILSRKNTDKIHSYNTLKSLNL